MPGPNGVITIPGDGPAAVTALKKLHAIATEGFEDLLRDEEAHDQGILTISFEPLDAKMKTVDSPDASPSSSHGATKPDNAEQVPTKMVQIGTKPSQIAHIGRGLGAK